VGPILLLFARSVFAVAAQGLVATICSMHGSATPWRDAGAWLPLYGTLIDAGCLCLLWWFARREGITLPDLIGFDRNRLGRDFLFGLALIPPSLVFILGGNFASSFLAYGNFNMPQIFQPLPLLPTLYAVLIFPLVWGIVEQTTQRIRIATLPGSLWKHSIVRGCGSVCLVLSAHRYAADVRSPFHDLPAVVAHPVFDVHNSGVPAPPPHPASRDRALADGWRSSIRRYSLAADSLTD